MRPFIIFSILGALTASAAVATAAERCGTVTYEKWFPGPQRPSQFQAGYVLNSTNGQKYVFVADNANSISSQFAQERAQYLANSIGKEICVLGNVLPVKTGCFGNHNEVITDFGFPSQDR